MCCRSSVSVPEVVCRFSRRPDVVILLVFPVLLYYPELSLTRSAQYETVMPNEKTAGYLYDFYRKEEAWLSPGADRRERRSLTGFYPVGTGSDRFSWHRWAEPDVSRTVGTSVL